MSKTGSDGNASVISDGETLIQIDCGLNYKTVNRLMNYDLYKVHNAVITHKHSDHISYASDFMKYGMKVWATSDTWKNGYVIASKTNCRTFQQGKQFEIGTFLIKPFPVAHTNTDGSVCENSGFLFYSKHTKERLLWVTDAAYIENTFPAVDYIAIECSYFDVDDYLGELEYINTFVEKRRLESHLSFNRCVKFLKKQDLSKVKGIRLLHITKSQGDIAEIMRDKMMQNFPKISIEI